MRGRLLLSITVIYLSLPGFQKWQFYNDRADFYQKLPGQSVGGDGSCVAGVIFASHVQYVISDSWGEGEKERETNSTPQLHVGYLYNSRAGDP